MVDSHGEQPEKREEIKMSVEKETQNEKLSARKASSGEELAQEVSALSTRLLQAMETQSELEEELGRERKDKERLGLENKELQTEVQNLREEMQELSAELFDEANNMVSDARKDAAREVAEIKRRNNQLKLQLEERDNLLEGLQAQLGALKQAMQERDEEEERLQRITGDSDEGEEEESYDSQNEDPVETDNKLVDGVASALSENVSTTSVATSAISTRPRLSRASSSRRRLTTVPTCVELNSPCRPHLRQDLASFKDFIALVRQAAKLREASGEHSGFTPTNIGPTSSSLSSNEHVNSEETPQTPPTHSAPFKQDESSPLTSIYSSYMSPQTHKEPPQLQLKDTRFFKKFISEDFEPTLRLDLAPGLSWLARRAIQASILDGTIVIDPIAAVNESYGVTLMTDMWVNGGFSEAAGAPRDANGEPINDSGDSTTTPKDPVEPKQRPVSALVSFARDARLVRSDKSAKDEEQLVSPPMSREEAIAQAARDLESRTSNESSSRGSAPPQAVSPPMATISACGFCGESRNHSLVYARLHYLRTGNASSDESGESTALKGYPLCGYCLVRVRSVCDYLTFLRSVKDGVWKVDGVASENRVWAECVRLKERMFWARVGGGFL